MKYSTMRVLWNRECLRLVRSQGKDRERKVALYAKGKGCLVTLVVCLQCPSLQGKNVYESRKSRRECGAEPML